MSHSHSSLLKENRAMTACLSTCCQPILITLPKLHWPIKAQLVQDHAWNMPSLTSCAQMKIIKLYSLVTIRKSNKIQNLQPKNLLFPIKFIFVSQDSSRENRYTNQIFDNNIHHSKGVRAMFALIKTQVWVKCHLFRKLIKCNWQLTIWC